MPPEAKPPTRLVVLASGAGSNLQALIAASADASYGACVVAVGADRVGIAALEHARRAGIDTFVVRLPDAVDRQAWDAALAARIASYRPSLVVSAGFMKLLGPASLAVAPVVNTHPALLPAFPGAHAVRDSLTYGVKVSGCTVHLVDEGVDTGPVIAQAAVPVRDDDDEASLHERIKVVERVLLVDTVGRLARHGWTLTGRKVSVP